MQMPIVEFEEWSIASIIRVGRSRRGVKTLLWITEYITKSFVIHYEGFELSHCISIELNKHPDISSLGHYNIWHRYTYISLLVHTK